MSHFQKGGKAYVPDLGSSYIKYFRQAVTRRKPIRDS